ncbi:MAG: nicotinate (nicotinamide) nucleotide adenylyltransferase [Verrucomicrobia bacterium]|nr:nicotinate (nicotinamide) nucleotide adenylyltransferase [Verrucomicrobiota bacterium]MBV9673509.1 nicotinate (nicotinamide) nucleotide adenylyltransferase [Verrucomicrobiota bacterium]
MKLGLYGGSFDPIHHGHLILARQALEELKLDALVFIPAAESPFKPNHTIAPAQDRLAMVRLAIEMEQYFGIDPIEIEREAPSYTIHTARAYRARNPTDELFFLIGEDHVESLPRWNEFNELKQIVQFVILSRSERCWPEDYPVIRKRIELSSTEIRNRVAKKQPISYLVPEKVLHYIIDKNLYQGH